MHTPVNKQTRKEFDGLIAIDIAYLSDVNRLDFRGHAVGHRDPGGGGWRCCSRPRPRARCV